MTHPDEFPVHSCWERLDASPPEGVSWYGLLSSDLQEFMTSFGQRAPVPVVRQKIGRSVEGRALETFRFGKGTRRVLVWARQHGDETECTAALCTVLRDLLEHADEPVQKAILENLDLLVFPNVNPDGMDRCTRQNATGIDLNREAQYLSQPEGRALVRLKDDFRPDFSFNLHDMCARKARTGLDAGLISLAYQAGPFDESNSDNDVRLRAKTVIAEMFRTVTKITPKESICVYKAYYMNRAFGDSMMRWGVPCVLIESGSWYSDQGGEDFVIRLHALSLLAGLYFVAVGADEPFNNDVYESIPFDVGTHEFDTLFRGGRVVDPESASLLKADVGVWTELQDFRTTPRRQFNSLVRNIGDLTEETAADQRDLESGVLVPGLVGIAPRLAGTELPQGDWHRPFLEAGVTTLAAAFGPFPARADRESFVQRALRQPPPLNIAALERVETIEGIVQRHGMTPLHGFALTDRSISGTELHAFLSELTGVPVASEQTENAVFGLDVFFVPSIDPDDVRLLLALSPAQEGNGSAPQPMEGRALRALAESFSIAANQTAFAWHGIEGAPAFPGVEIMPVVFGSAAAPSPDWTVRFLQGLAERTPQSVAGALSLLTSRPAQALRLPMHGSLRQTRVADLALYDDALVGEGVAAELRPRVVMLNGRIVVDRDKPACELAPSGLWHLAK